MPNNKGNYQPSYTQRYTKINDSEYCDEYTNKSSRLDDISSSESETDNEYGEEGEGTEGVEGTEGDEDISGSDEENEDEYQKTEFDGKSNDTVIRNPVDNMDVEDLQMDSPSKDSSLTDEGTGTPVSNTPPTEQAAAFFEHQNVDGNLVENRVISHSNGNSGEDVGHVNENSHVDENSHKSENGHTNEDAQKNKDITESNGESEQHKMPQEKNDRSKSEVKPKEVKSKEKLNPDSLRSETKQRIKDQMNFDELNKKYELAYPRKTYGLRLRDANIGKYKNSSQRLNEISRAKGVEDVLLADIEIDAFTGEVTLRVEVDNYKDYRELMMPWPKNSFRSGIVPELTPLTGISVIILEVETSIVVDQSRRVFRECEEKYGLCNFIRIQNKMKRDTKMVRA